MLHSDDDKRSDPIKKNPAPPAPTIQIGLVPESVSVDIKSYSPSSSHRVICSPPRVEREPPSPHSDPGTNRSHVQLARIGSLRPSQSTADIKSQLKNARTLAIPVLPIKAHIKARKILRRQEEALHLLSLPWYSQCWSKFTSGVSWACNFYPENSYSIRFVQTCFAALDGYGGYNLAAGMITSIGSTFTSASTPALIISSTATGYVVGAIAFKLTLGAIGSHFRSAGYVEERVNAISHSQQNVVNLVNTLVHRVDNDLKQNEQLRDEMRKGFTEHNKETAKNNERAQLLYAKADLLFKQAKVIEETTKKLQDDAKKMMSQSDSSAFNSEPGIRKRTATNSQ